MARETLSSRLGFFALAAGCTIGLGNVWRFPFVTGEYGGGAFVLIYLVFLAILGYPILTMELAIGRAGGSNLVGSYRKLPAKHGNLFGRLGMLFFAGNLILLMYYSTVTGWLGSYLAGYLQGNISSCSGAEATGAYFNTLISDPVRSTAAMVIVTGISAIVCACGLRSGVEKCVKMMMALLFVILVVLAIRCLFLPGAGKALKFYLLPDFSRAFEKGIGNLLYAAMGQAFFTLSVGIGSMAIFGSYIGKERSLGGESIFIIILDTVVALLAGAIIFPICFSYGVNVNQGPGLIFVSLPNIFNTMPMPKVTGTVFFLFLLLAAMTTLIAVIENLAAFLIDEYNLPRRISAIIAGIGVTLLSVPCALGFGVLKSIQPLGKGSCILDLEDFIVSQNLLPLGALFVLYFCVSKHGWGWKNFLAEADCGTGMRFPTKGYLYIKYILTVLIVAVFITGYIQQFDLINKVTALFK